MDSAATLGAAFDSRRNALNAMRLVLALLVVVWHSVWLAGPAASLAWPVRQLLEELPVDAFFAVSGLLITRAWLRRSEPAAFLTARALRLLPGLWVCLAVTAFVLAPLGGRVLQPGSQLDYVLGNAAILPFSRTIEGSGVLEWNVSLWTLGWEAGCYLAVAALGMLGWLRPKVVFAFAVACWTFAATLMSLGDIPGRAWFDAMPRLGLMFACGSLLWMWRQSVPLRGSLAALAAAAIVGGSFLPDYRLVAAPALAYLAAWAGLALGRWRRLVIRSDLSYGVYVYGFPIQQLLLVTGTATGWLALTGLTVLAVVPLAAASWLLVEKPAMRLRPRVLDLTARVRGVRRSEPVLEARPDVGGLQLCPLPLVTSDDGSRGGHAGEPGQA